MSITSVAAWPREKTRQVVQWAVWSRRRFLTVVVVVLCVLGVAATATLTGIAIQVQEATSGRDTAPAAPPTYDPGTLATGDVYAPTPPAQPRHAPVAAGTPEVTARGFITAWLAGGEKAEQERPEWILTMAPYGGPALRAQLETARLTDVPVASVVDVKSAVMQNSATATVTLSTGRIVLVQLVRGDGAWAVQGFHAG